LARQDSLLLQWEKEEETLKQMIHQQQQILSQSVLHSSDHLVQQKRPVVDTHLVTNPILKPIKKQEKEEREINEEDDDDDVEDEPSKEQAESEELLRKLSRSDIRRHRLKSSQHNIQHAAELLTGIVISTNHSTDIPDNAQDGVDVQPKADAKEIADPSDSLPKRQPKELVANKQYDSQLMVEEE